MEYNFLDLVIKIQTGISLQCSNSNLSLKIFTSRCSRIYLIHWLHKGIPVKFCVLVKERVKVKYFCSMIQMLIEYNFLDLVIKIQIGISLQCSNSNLSLKILASRYYLSKNIYLIHCYSYVNESFIKFCISFSYL